MFSNIPLMTSMICTIGSSRQNGLSYWTLGECYSAPKPFVALIFNRSTSVTFSNPIIVVKFWFLNRSEKNQCNLAASVHRFNITMALFEWIKFGWLHAKQAQTVADHIFSSTRTNPWFFCLYFSLRVHMFLTWLWECVSLHLSISQVT